MEKTLSLCTVSQKQVGTSRSRIYLKELKRERKRLGEIGRREGGTGKEGGRKGGREGRRESERERERNLRKETTMSAVCLKGIYRPAKYSDGHPVLSSPNTCIKKKTNAFLKNAS